MRPARSTEGYSATRSREGYSMTQVARRPGPMLTADQRAYDAHHASILREIKSLAGESGVRAVLTPKQLSALDKDATTWPTPVLDTILHLIKTIIHGSLPGVRNATAEHCINEAREWMLDQESVERHHPIGAGDVQKAVKRCQVEYADKKVAEGQQMMTEYHLLEAHKKAIQDTLEVFKKSITECSSTFEAVWDNIENEVNERHGILTHDLKQWLQEQIYELWEQARPLPLRKYTFPADRVGKERPQRGRAKGQLRITWNIPPGGTYDRSTGNITYKTTQTYEEIYGIDEPDESSSYDPRPKDIEVKRLVTKLVEVKIDGQRGCLM